MISEQDQKELFEFEKPKKAFPGLRRILRFPSNTMGITLSMERVIFISIGILMIMVILYALGVEKGKSQARPPAIIVQKALPITAPKPRGALPPKIIQAPVPVRGQAVEAALPAAARPYTIIAGAFSGKAGAQAEVDRLRKEGLDTFSIQSDPYFLVCVGTYATREGAQKALPIVRQKHKDAYIKLK